MANLTISVFICMLVFLLTSCGLFTKLGEQPVSPNSKYPNSAHSTHSAITQENSASTQENSASTQENSASTQENSASTQESKGMRNPEQLISAQVILVSATGQRLEKDTLITSENINSYRPSAETVQLVSQYFQSNGFEVSPLVGISFTISASGQHFSDVFQVSLTEDAAGGIQATAGSTEPRAELPLASLTPDITDSITSVTFVPPPSFGPTSFSY